FMWLPFSLVSVSPSGSGRRRGSGSAVSPRSGLAWNPFRFGDEGSAHPTELDTVVLVGSALLRLRQPREDACVGLGPAAGDEAAGPEPHGAGGVDLRRVPRDLGREAAPGSHG